MKKVFLSHSSVNKDFVEKVAKDIGLDNCVYDKYTFEDGMKTLDEIYKSLDETDIFVFFISDEALNSKWVIKERQRAKKLLEKCNLLRFYPIIIDNRIAYDDERIPSWMKCEYNIRSIMSHQLAANKIKARMREVVWQEYPIIKRKNTLFVGRNKEVEKFEVRRADFDKQELKCLVVSSVFSGIGRKAYMQHVLKKSSFMSESYTYNLIVLERHESIEDFILKISDLGKGSVDVSQVARMTLNEKIEIASGLVKYIQEHNEFIFINDCGVIVKPNQELAGWFEEILHHIEPKVALCVASVYYLNMRNAHESVFSIRMPELDRQERNLLFKEYCDISEVDILPQQKKDIASLLSGYPEQVIYTIKMILDESVQIVLQKLHEIVSYADEKAQLVLDEFVNSESKNNFLVFLSSFDFVGYDIIEKSYEENSTYKDYLNEFLSLSICEFIGADGEYIRVNDVLKDILFRKRLKMGTKLEKLYDSLLDCTVDDEFFHKNDLANYYNIARRKLAKGELDDKFIIPSHYIKCIVEQYNSRQYEKASQLCRRVLKSDRLSAYDNELIYVINFYYCQSLSREHDREFYEAIKYEGFKHEDRKFLYGFHYRINGNPLKAVENLLEALKHRKDFPKARRELANAYIVAEDYKSAFVYCKKNYEEDRRNPYYIHPYFETIIHQYLNNKYYGKVGEEKNEELVVIMEELIDAMEGDDWTATKQMSTCMRAEFEAYVNDDFENAMQVIDREVSDYNETRIYLYLTQFDIAYRAENKSIMEKVINKIENEVNDLHYFSNALNIRKARFYATIGNMDEARLCIQKVKNIPLETMKRLENEVGACI